MSSGIFGNSIRSSSKNSMYNPTIWKKYNEEKLRKIWGPGPFRQNMSRGSSMLNVNNDPSGGPNLFNEMEFMKQISYHMLCSKMASIDDLCNKKLNDEAFDFKMESIRKHKEEQKKAAEAAKKKKR